MFPRLGASAIGIHDRGILLRLVVDPNPTIARFSFTKESVMTQMLGLIAFIGAFLALIALMPDFQGPHNSGWDRQEDDDD